MNLWESVAAAATKPLTEEDVLRAVAAIRERSDWELAHPHGIDPENPHIVSLRSRERLIRDDGGYAFCGVCGPCYIHGKQ